MTCRLISELEERVEQVSLEIANLEGVDRKAAEISDRQALFSNIHNQHFSRDFVQNKSTKIIKGNFRLKSCPSQLVSIVT